MTPRAAIALRVTAAALLALSFASAPMPALAASVLSDGTVTPTSGTTATAFTFSVHYTSTGSPTRPAQAVWAQVAGATVTLSKVSGNSHDGTWQGTASLPAGTWQVTFHATTSGDPQPDPLPGPIVTVTGAATPAPTPPPTATPPPVPPPPTAPPIPQPTVPPTDGDNPIPTQTPSPSPSATPRGSESARSPTPVPTPTGASADDEDPAATPEPSIAAADDADSSPGSRLASFLIVGGTMSLAGAAVLARQWFVSHHARRGSKRG